jgi:hypothetical protein
VCSAWRSSLTSGLCSSPSFRVRSFADVVKGSPSSSPADAPPPPLPYRTKVQFTSRPNVIESWAHLPSCEVCPWAGCSEPGASSSVVRPMPILRVRRDHPLPDPLAGQQHGALETVTD